MIKRIPTSTLLWIFFLANCTGYNIEKDGVYYKRFDEAQGPSKRLIKDADPESFVVLEYEYGKDNKHVFYQGNIIPGAEPSSFNPLTRLYAVDGFKAYYAGDSISSSTARGFTIIDDYYSKDTRNVFYTTKALNVCSITNFHIYPNKNKEDIRERWSTDGCFYYFKHFKIPSKDYKNVKLYIESAGFAKDKQWVYYLDRKINYDHEGKRIIDTVDAETFNVINYLDCRDKYGCINVFHGREKCE